MVQLKCQIITKFNIRLLVRSFFEPHWFFAYFLGICKKHSQVVFDKSTGSFDYVFCDTDSKCFKNLVIVWRQSELCVFWRMASAVRFFIVFLSGINKQTY